MSLDIRTIFFDGVINTMVGLAVLVALWHRLRQRFDGLGFWVADYALLLAGQLLLIQRGTLPDFVTMVVANCLIVGSSLAGYEGLLRFVGRRVRQWPNLAALGAFAAVHAWFAVAQPDLRARNVNLAILIALYCGQSAWLLLRSAGPAVRSYSFAMGLACLGYSVVNVARAGYEASTGPVSNDYFHSGSFQAAVLVVYLALFLFQSFAFVLMVSRRLQLEVAAQEEKYSKAFRAAPYAMLMTRLSDGKVVEVNDGFVALSGASREQALASSSVALHLWDRAEDRADLVRDLLERGSVHDREYRFRRQSGEVLLGVLSAELLRVGDESYALSCIQDVTLARRAEDGLRASEERHRVTLASLGDAVISTDAAARVDLLNPAAERLTGWTSQQARGQPLEAVFRIVHEQTREPVESPAARVLREGCVVGLANHTVLLQKSGGEVPIADSGAPIRDASGAVTGVVLVFRDQTAERLAQAEVTDERGRLQAILDAAPAAIFLVDQDERVVLSNPAAASLFRATAAIGKRCGDLLGCVHRGQGPQGCGTSPDCPACPLWRAVREGLAGTGARDLELELHLDRGAGPQKRSLLANVAPLQLQGRRGAVLAVHDVTDLRRSQHERERLQASLSQSDRLASMGMLAAGVAHEINNPLSCVLYNLESLGDDLPRFAQAAQRCAAVLDDRLGPAEASSALGPARADLRPGALDDALARLRDSATGARRIVEITRSLGTFSWADRAEVEPVDLVALLERALTLSFHATKYRARVVRDLAPLPPVLASEAKVAQVFLNLLLNAAHAIPEGHVQENQVRVRTWAEAGFARVEVADTGRLVAPELLGRVFDPFFTRQGAGVGAGLGLSISREIVAEFGGSIEVASDAAAGTRFRVSLPALAQDGQDGHARPAEAPADAAPQGPRGRILVVDDEPEVRRMLSRMLTAHHDVVAAGSGREALAALAGGDARFDLVLSDLMMPEMSGVELHRRVAEQDPALAARFVFLTAGAFSPEVAEYVARAGVPRLLKPFDPRELLQLVGQVVAKSKGEPGTRQGG